MTEPIIEVRDLWHWYLRRTPLESIALEGASFELRPGEVVGILSSSRRWLSATVIGVPYRVIKTAPCCLCR